MSDDDFSVSCPAVDASRSEVLLAHGSGGSMTQQLIDQLILPAFDNPMLRPLHDGATVQIGNTRLAFATDSYVVRPCFFPGGDIGSLSVHGTVNDLAMCGARPLVMSAAFIIEEGLAIADLQRIIKSMQSAAEQAGVLLVTGDTKVVDKGCGDQIYINTSGIGRTESDYPIQPDQVCAGDAVILSGDIGRHGMAVMTAREGLRFDSPILSDSAALADVVLSLIKQGIALHCLRDPTRGGLATALVDIAQSAQVGIDLIENAIPVTDLVRGACEVLGLDPLYVANEGRFIAFVPAQQIDDTLSILRKHPLGEQACCIGTVNSDAAGTVTATTAIGSTRAIDRLSGEQLPRIC